MTRALQPNRARPLHPRAKSIVALCHRPGRYLQKEFVRRRGGIRLAQFTIEPEGWIVAEEHALQAIASHLTPRDLDLFGQPATWAARR